MENEVNEINQELKDALEREMMEIINKPIIDPKTQDIMDNLNETVHKKVDEFGIMFNPDGTEKTKEDLEGIKFNQPFEIKPEEMKIEEPDSKEP
jgi:formylmethanofuran:tetrahydromethanopterin formyltransferase